MEKEFLFCRDEIEENLFLDSVVFEFEIFTFDTRSNFFIREIDEDWILCVDSNLLFAFQ